MSSVDDHKSISIPVIFLKNPLSGPPDPYTSHFSHNPPPPTSLYQPHYVHVLDHTHDLAPIIALFSHLYNDGTDAEGPSTLFPYGGLIFTSGRAVEAFAAALEQLSSSAVSNPSQASATILQRLCNLAIPLYAVGPATAASLHSLRARLPACWIRGGEEAGTGELLAKLILQEHQNPSNPVVSGQPSKDELEKPLLFLAGAKHRDVVPVTLKSHGIGVEEIIVYATTEARSFPSKLASALVDTADAPVRWIVIFSPTGGESLLRALGLLDKESSKVRGADDPCWVDRKTFIASIGPTTSDYMKDTFGLGVDVCAARPRPEGVRQGIEDFMTAKGWMS
ncbi:MAG: hypothetical protein LQ350_000931 [Teloschistes chrysophthalmus]|nr:MAG: hypothetical protein LQ350_000931 [Niorma chrysophthalma]